MRYIQTDELSDEVRRILFQWTSDPFQSKAWGITWRPMDHHILVYEDNQPVSHVGLVRETVSVGSEQLAVGGLGKVITIPGFRGRGLAQLGINAAVRILIQEWNLKHGLLFCFPPLKAFYESLGWTTWKEAVWVSQPQGRIALPFLSMVQAWDGAEWPSGEIEIQTSPW
jgi:hypothetical protein